MRNSYLRFLFNEDGSLKSRNAPVITTNEDGSYILKYSVPGYHTPRQYFKFVDIPEHFPNEYVKLIFGFFSVTNSFLFRRPHNCTPKVRKSIINEILGVKNNVRVYSEEDIELANYNLNLAISLGRSRHSLFYFDQFLDAYKILHPEIRYTQNAIKNIQALFNKLIS